MWRVCEEPDCGRRYDDARSWTICLHNPLESDVRGQAEGNPRGYCREHDLFACPFHDDSPGPTDAYRVADVRVGQVARPPDLPLPQPIDDPEEGDAP